MFIMEIDLIHTMTTQGKEASHLFIDNAHQKKQKINRDVFVHLVQSSTLNSQQVPHFESVLRKLDKIQVVNKLQLKF